MNLATIQRIHSINIHPNADTLLIAKVLDWPVVVRKDEFKENDLVVFITIDSVVPKENPYFSFMGRMKYRIWNARFRGEPSSGLVCPLSILPQDTTYSEGDDVTDLLKIVKYEKALDTTMGGDALGNFPTNLISITDEDNIKSHGKALLELEGKDVYISQKADGSSTSFIHQNAEFLACSRRFILKENSGFPWQAANKYDLKSKLLLYAKNIAIQAECIGPKLNGNSLELKELEIRVFRAKDLDTGKIYNLNQLTELCKILDLPMVSIVEIIKFDSKIHTIDYFQNLANSQRWPTNGKQAEGIVIAPVEPFYSNILEKSFSCKIIAQDYK